MLGFYAEIKLIFETVYGMPIRHNSPPKNMGLTELPLLPFRNPPFWFGFIPEEVS